MSIARELERRLFFGLETSKNFAVLGMEARHAATVIIYTSDVSHTIFAI